MSGLTSSLATSTSFARATAANASSSPPSFSLQLARSLSTAAPAAGAAMVGDGPSQASLGRLPEPPLS